MFRLLLPACLLAILAGCGTQPPPGSSSYATAVSHSAESRCAHPLASVAIESQQPLVFMSLGLPLDSRPAMRLVAEKSGCFTIVDNPYGETPWMIQRMAAYGGSHARVPDYTILVEVAGSDNSLNSFGIPGTSPVVPMLNMIPVVGGVVSIAAMGVHSHDASVRLTLINTRTRTPLDTVVGKNSNVSWSFDLGFGGYAGGYDTKQGRVVMAAMADALNQLEARFPGYQGSK